MAQTLWVKKDRSLFTEGKLLSACLKRASHGYVSCSVKRKRSQRKWEMGRKEVNPENPVCLFLVLHPQGPNGKEMIFLFISFEITLTWSYNQWTHDHHRVTSCLTPVQETVQCFSPENLFLFWTTVIHRSRYICLLAQSLSKNDRW